MSRAARRLVAVAALAVAFGAMAADRGWVGLGGEALSRALADQDLGDGVHFAYQFLADGELHGMNMGKAAHGRWRVAGNRLCWRWAKSQQPEECHEVRRHGQAVRLFIDGQEVLSGTLTPLAGQPLAR